MHNITKLDLSHLKKQLRYYQKEKDISDPQIGVVLGSSSKSTSGQGAVARAFYNDPKYDVTLSQIMSIGKFIGTDPKTLVFKDDSSVIRSEGEQSMNAVNLADGEVHQIKKENTINDEQAVIQYLQKCNGEQIENIKDFIEYLQIKRRNNNSKKK